MRFRLAIVILAAILAWPRLATPDPRQRAYALIDGDQAEMALATGDVVLLEDALAGAQAVLASLPALDTATGDDELEAHLTWQLFWYRLRALGTDDDTNLYARELAFLAAFPAPDRLAIVRASFHRLFEARELIARHPRISRLAEAQHGDFAQAIEAYAPRFARTVVTGTQRPVVDTASVYANPWAAAQLQQSREILRSDPAAALAVIRHYDADDNRADLARAQAESSRTQAEYWLNRVKVRLLVLQDAVNLLHQEPRLRRLVGWYEARGPLYRDPRAGGLAAEMELYAAVAPALAKVRSGELRTLRETSAQIADLEARLRRLPAAPTDELYVLDFPAGFVR